MILQCPNCGTRFNVPDGAIQPEGRKVKCANCGHKWVATPDSAVQEEAAARPTRRKRPPQQGAAGPRRQHRPGSPRQASQRPVNAGRQSAEQATARTRPPRRPQQTSFETPDDLNKDAALAAQHHSLRRQLGEEFSEPSAPMPDDIDPLSGIADDDAMDQPVAARSASAGMDADADIKDDDLDFMAKVSSGATMAGPGTGTEHQDDDLDDSLTSKKKARLGGFKPSMPKGLPKPSIPSFAPTKTVLRAAWAGLAIFWLTILSMVLVCGDALQSMWPASSQIFAALTSVSDVERIRANADKLSAPITDAPEIINVGLYEDDGSNYGDDGARYRWITRDGKNYLSLNILIRNGGTRAVSVPKVQITFLDKDNRAIGNWQEDPPGRILTRGSYLTFTVERADYPNGGIARVVATAIEGSKSEGEAELP